MFLKNIKEKTSLKPKIMKSQVNFFPSLSSCFWELLYWRAYFSPVYKHISSIEVKTGMFVIAWKQYEKRQQGFDLFIFYFILLSPFLCIDYTLIKP